MSAKNGQKPLLIEVDGQPQGVVIPKGEQFHFLAVKLPVFAIDGLLFNSVAEAEMAASAAIADHHSMV